MPSNVRDGPTYIHQSGDHDPTGTLFLARFAWDYRVKARNSPIRTTVGSSFNHVICESEPLARQLQAELPGSFLVHDQLKLGWALDRQLGRIGTAQNEIQI